MASKLMTGSTREVCIKNRIIFHVSLIYGCVWLLLCCPAWAQAQQVSSFSSSSDGKYLNLPAPSPLPPPPCQKEDPTCSSSSFASASSSSSTSPASASPSSSTSTNPSSDVIDRGDTADKTSDHITLDTSNPESENRENVESSPQTNHLEEEKAEPETQDDDEPNEDEQIITCVFSSVPLVGGEWLSNLARRSFSDGVLLDAILTFLAGGELMTKFMDPGARSSSARLLYTFNSCFDNDEDVSKYTGEESVYESSSPEETIVNSIDAESEPEEFKTIQQGSRMRIPLSSIPHRRKRRLAGSGGYGYDSLLGFNLLALLVVGALITYLVYLLIM